jgi:cysteinyl-tRNA synthetase
MNDDFNTALAISAIFDLIKEINKCTETHREIERQTKKEVSETIKTLLEDILGITITMERKKAESSKQVEDLMKLIFTIRQQLRQKADWKASDEIRSNLQKLGFIVEDTSGEPKWKIKQSDA